ncbi:DUF262 domain-containing protein [Hymenobacter sp. BT664]|uniref:DUF262 domain-containing protein n=1 Tax=Hymenobacter montanus TaxID=2771359 RepID=A0A927GJF3_9BACT|nr:DUF262 domain-containing protein [Hymenobacter montanus]MBD2768056.1 DUF262 domain-containing protein [Hymenobacter montanus]
MLKDHPRYSQMRVGDEAAILTQEAEQLITKGWAELAPLPEPVSLPIAAEAVTEPSQTGVEVEDIEGDPQDATGESIIQPFDPKKIQVSIQQLTVDSIIKRIANDEIDLTTPFQRAAGLWKDQEQSRLIESILIRFPLPAFYFDGSDDDHWLVVDGLQRLSTLRRFIHTNELQLTGMEYLQQFEGCKFKELPRSMQRTIEEAQITAYIIKPGTPEQVKFNLFKRINTGGLMLRPQEIRHALNQGTPANLVADLAALSAFKTATGGSVDPRRMDDRDFVMRFVAFYLTPYPLYQPDLDTFLNTQMNKLGLLTLAQQATLKADFTRALQLARDIFARQAFRKMMTPEPRGLNPINKALFESWTVSLSRLTEEQGRLLVARQREVVHASVNLMQDTDFLRAISSATGDRKRVEQRFRAVERLIREQLQLAGDEAIVPGFAPAPPTSSEII